MPTPENIRAQQARLQQYRTNVQTTLQQIAEIGTTIDTSLKQLRILRENRAEIARCKAILRNWGVYVEDHPDDEEESDVVITSPVSERMRTNVLAGFLKMRTISILFIIAIVVIYGFYSIKEYKLRNDFVKASVAWNVDKNGDVAISILNSILYWDEDFFDAHILIGRVYMQSKDDNYNIQKAIEHFEKAKKINPGHFDGYYNAALAYSYVAGDIDIAIDNASEAIRIDGNREGAWKNRGQFYLQKGGHVCEAINDFETALMVVKKKKVPYTPVYFFMGEAYRKLNDWDKAKYNYDLFVAELEKRPNDPESAELRKDRLPSSLQTLGPRPSTPNPVVCK